jgi:predicted PurR-regulated permease PerM
MPPLSAATESRALSDPRHAAPEPPSSPVAGHGTLDSPLGTMASAPDPGTGGTVSAFSLSSWAVARHTLAVALVVGALVLLWKIQEALLLLLLAIIFATAIEPLVNRLRRGPFSRGQGILIVYTTLFVGVAAIVFFFVPPLVDQATTFVMTMPDRVSALRPQIEQIEFSPVRSALLRAVGEAPIAVQRSLEEPAIAAQGEQLVAAGGALAHTVFSMLTVFLLAYYWLAERSTIKRSVLRLVPPARAGRVNATWLAVEAKLGNWVRGQLLAMLALGVMAAVACALLGLPNPVLLGVLAGVAEIIPLVGPFLAFLPAVLVALAVDPTKVLFLVPTAIVIQQIEGNILIPRIMSHTVGVSPLTVILGILIGSIVYGPAGAFLAVPVAAAIQVILGEIIPTLQPNADATTQGTPEPASEGGRGGR